MAIAPEPVLDIDDPISEPEETFEPSGLGETIFRERYARSPEETWEEACKRVAEHIAQAEENGDFSKYASRFQRQLATNRFMPGGRIWYGSGRPKGQLGNCYVLSVADTREGWGKTTSDVIVISGLMGGVGMNVSPVRPRGYPVKGTGGYATGAVSFMQLINGVGDVLVGGGGRRMALMLCLDVNHPDLEEFLEVKLDLHQLTNANISVVIPDDMPTEEFVRMVKEDEEIPLIFNGMPSGKSVSAKWLWDKLVDNAWTSGEPGVLNGYLANKMNNVHYSRRLTSTNPSMPAGTLVGTRNGILPIETLEDTVFEVKSLDGTWAKAHCFLSGENEEVLEIQFSKNRVTHSTKEHRWPVLGRMGGIHKVYADELRPGDLIPLNRNELPGIEGDLSLTEEDGFFAGYLLGDGWITQRKTGNYALGFVFSRDERDIADRICAYMNANKKSRSSVRNYKSHYYVQATDQSFIKNVIDRFGFKIDKSAIPDKVWQSNDSFIQGFIDGWLSADGYVSEADAKNPCVILTTAKKQLAVDFSKLISFFGVPSTIASQETTSRFPNKKDYRREYVRYDVRIVGGSVLRFTTVFDISHERKHSRLGDLARRAFRLHERNEYARVESIVSIGNAPVWDISVDYKQHVFPSQYAYTGNCGEIWMGEYDACILGALVLPRFVKDGEFNWDDFDESVRLGVRFLDNVVTINHYPLPEVKETCESLRRLGLGVMGVHTMLLEMGMKYDSPEALEFVDRLFNTLKNTAYDASINLAIEKGPFPEYDPRFLDSGFAQTLKRGIRNKIREHGIRNCALLTVAPTGTTSIVSNVSSALEPLPPAVYWRSFFKNTKDGRRELQRELVVEDAYYKYPDLVQSAIDVPIQAHFEMQRVVQQHVDNATSKTINMAKDFPKDQFGDLWLEYLPTLKGTTIYRYGSRENEPINPVPREQWDEVIAANEASDDVLTVDEILDLDCPDGVCSLDARPLQPQP